MERRLAAILAADVQGYSRHTERNEEASTATLRLYNTVVEEAISAHKGHIFSSAGDGVVAEFPSIVEAIRCALEIQNEVAERNKSVPESEQMQFRIGVNLGDVIAEGDNLYGTGVNVAARLEQFAEPGGICVSQTVYDQVRKIIEIPFEDIGERRLRNISDPVHIYRITAKPSPWPRRVLSRANLRRGLASQPAPLSCFSRWRRDRFICVSRLRFGTPCWAICRTSRTPRDHRFTVRRHESHA